LRQRGPPVTDRLRPLDVQEIREQNFFGASLEEDVVNRAGGTGRRRLEPRTFQAVALVAICLAVLSGVGLWNLLSVRAADDGQEAARVSVFTLVSTGIVYVEPGSSEIVWKNTEGEQNTIGEDPWANPGTARPSELTGAPAWRDNRDIVGNPEHDLVAWVETREGERGDVVVVQASTGYLLARTPVPPPPDRSVVIAGIDDATVYFATPDHTLGWPDIPGIWIWVWNWTAGAAAANHGVDRFYNDVTAGTWAVYELDNVDFERRDRYPIATVRSPTSYRTDFGSAFSPDGRYWYGAGTSLIVETATGNSVSIPATREQDYGWTGPTELTLTDPSIVCSAVTGHCRGPAGIPPNPVCAPYGIVCGNHLPVN
jgi:hypothetical protein